MERSPATGLDVITVPDFSVAGHRFEARTLFFLASWIDSGPKKHPCSLHLACIGEPPKGVSALAEIAQAKISVHEPLLFGYGGFVNKLRGLEVVPQHSRFLLLDADILVWSDPTDVVQFGNCLAASAAARPRIPAEYWPQIYAQLGIPVPEERIPCRYHQTGRKLPHDPALERGDRMTPYFNTGVIYGPWPAGLRGMWAAHARTIANAFGAKPGVPLSVSHCDDQVAFSTALQELRQSISFRFLPDRYHVIRPVLACGTVTLSDMVLLHAVGFLNRAETRASVPQEVRVYEEKITATLRRRALVQRRPAREAARFRLWLRRLYRGYVAPFLSGPT